MLFETTAIVVFSFIAISAAQPNSPNVLNTTTAKPQAVLYEWESRLFKQLFDGYVRDARPAKHLGGSVHVNVDMMIMKINALVERDQEIILTGYLKIAWKDERLAWRPQDYGGIEWIVAPSSNIWIPDVGLINSIDMYSITRDFRFPAVVDFNGNVIWVPAGKFAARCELDVTYFPFDNQTCFYRFESWSYPCDFLNITGTSIALNPAHYVPDQQWNITSIVAKTYVVSYEAGLYSFSRIDFVLRIHRKPLYFVTYTIMPALALSALQVCSHLLPVADSNRIAFATTTLIAFSVIHVSVSENMPKTSDSVPLVAIYVDVVMGLIAASLIEAFLIANCLEKAAGSAPPKWLWFIIVEFLGRFVLIDSEKNRRNFIELKKTLSDVKKEKQLNVIKKKTKKAAPLPKMVLAPSPLPSVRTPLPPSEASSLKLKPELLRDMHVNGCSGSVKSRNGKRDRSQHHPPAPVVFTVSDFNQQLDKRTPVPMMPLNDDFEAGLLWTPHLDRDGNITNGRYSLQVPTSASNQTNLSQYTTVNGKTHSSSSSECSVCRNLLKSLNNVYQDVALLRHLCDDLADRQLRELSRDVWNALLSVIDRYIFIVAMCVCVLTPFYLFVIIPPAPERAVQP